MMRVYTTEMQQILDLSSAENVHTVHLLMISKICNTKNDDTTHEGSIERSYRKYGRSGALHQ